MMRTALGALGTALALLLWTSSAAGQATSPPAPPAKAAAVAPEVEPSAWIGVGLRGGTGTRGVPLDSIYPGTPAADAGLLAGDEIVSVNGQNVSSNADLIGAVKRYAAGETVKLWLFRDGRARLVAVTLAQKPTRSELAQRQLIDKPVPTITTATTGGGPSSFAAMRGEVVIAAFVTSTCRSCDSTLRALERLRREHGHRDLRVVGVAMESPPAMRAMARRLGLGFSFLVGINGMDASLFAWSDLGSPLVIVVDRGGIVRYAGMVDDHVRPADESREARMIVDRASLVIDRVLGRRARRASR